MARANPLGSAAWAVGLLRVMGRCRMKFWWFFWGVVHAGSGPDASVSVDVVARWRAQTAQLHLSVPEGQHVAPEAPLRVELAVADVPWMLESSGGASNSGLPFPIPAARPVTVKGTVTLSVCEDAGTTCRVVERSVQGILDGRRGRGILLEPAEQAVADPTSSSTDFADVLEAAGDGLVLIDFGAVWCPPCNLLSAEILHDAADADLFEDIRLFEVDVDDHASWAIKDRYAVGGYPTLVAVDGAGAEVARMVGYPGEAATKDWIAALDTTVPLSRPPEPSTLTPEEAGAWALRFVKGQRGERASPYLDRAAEGDEVVLDATLAAYLLQPNADLALSLCDAGLPVTIWGWSALGLVDARPELGDRVRQSARAALVGASGPEAADLFDMLAAASPEAVRPDLYRAGAVALSTGLSGDLTLDRGHIGWLSRMWEYAGAPDQAAAVLEPALARWPDDMTFHEDRATLALRTGDLETAILEGALAVEHGLGDNRLRAMTTYATALDAAGRTEEARALVQRALDTTAVPEAGLQVRTPRYLDALRTLPFMDVDASPPPTP